MFKILLVEDNEMNRDMLARRLERKGYEVVIAIDGQEAVRMAQSLTPDLILMDIRLPVMDGWEAMQRIKTMPETQSIPIIALTAHAMSTDRDKCLNAGCDDYATKPIDRETLISLVAERAAIGLGQTELESGSQITPAEAVPGPGDAPGDPVAG